MKVFALICAAAVAISTSSVEAVDVPVACLQLACQKDSVTTLGKDAVATYTPPACGDTNQKAYLKQIAITGTSGDLYTFVTKSAGTALTDATCKLTSAAQSVAGGTVEAPLTCGKGLDTVITVEVTCAKASGDCDPTADAVTFDCAAKTEEPAATDDVAVTCTDVVCTKDKITIPDGKKAVYTPKACTTDGEKAYLKQIAITGATGDKLTFVTKSAGTALTDAACVDSTADATVVSGTDQAPLTCGKGLDSAITVEVSCARGDGTACAPSKNDVTFGCSAKAAQTPAPSTGSMLTKANAIVGVISGMVGAIVYFNRG